MAQLYREYILNIKKSYSLQAVLLSFGISLLYPLFKGKCLPDKKWSSGDECEDGSILG
jgi:hypothetical protein